MKDEDIIRELTFVWQNITDKKYARSTNACKISSLVRLERLLSSHINVFDHVRKSINELQLSIFDITKEDIENGDKKITEIMKDFNKFSQQKAEFIFNQSTQYLNAESLNLENDKAKYHEILEVIRNLSTFAAEDIYIALDEKYNISKKTNQRVIGMKDKIIKYLRWILFLPVSSILAEISAKIIVFLNNSYVAGMGFLHIATVYVSYFIEPYLMLSIFFWSAVKIIPSDKETKATVSLVCVLIICTVNIYLNLLIKSGNVMLFDTDFHFKTLQKFIPSTLGYGICFLYVIFALCNKEEHDKLVKKIF